MTIRHTFLLFIGEIIEIELFVSPSFGKVRFDDCPLRLFLSGKANGSSILQLVKTYRFFDDATVDSLYSLLSGNMRGFWLCL
jgi:hypothetical protein